MYLHLDFIDSVVSTCSCAIYNKIALVLAIARRNTSLLVVELLTVCESLGDLNEFIWVEMNSIRLFFCLLSISSALYHNWLRQSFDRRYLYLAEMACHLHFVCSSRIFFGFPWNILSWTMLSFSKWVYIPQMPTILIQSQNNVDLQNIIMMFRAQETWRVYPLG